MRIELSTPVKFEVNFRKDVFYDFKQTKEDATKPPNRRKYIVKIHGPTGSAAFGFYGSEADFNSGKKELTKEEKFRAVNCVLGDAFIYMDNQEIDDFASELGITSIAEANRTYKACKETYTKLTETCGLYPDDIRRLYNQTMEK